MPLTCRECSASILSGSLCGWCEEIVCCLQLQRKVIVLREALARTIQEMEHVRDSPVGRLTPQQRHDIERGIKIAIEALEGNHGK